MPKLSIIVPVYKVEPYIHKCVNSILNQTYTDFELILVDDGSPDNCGKICDEYAQKDKRVRVIHKENGGVSSARNLGIDEAKGEYISFIDPDDWIDLDMYENLFSFIDNEKLDIVCFEVYEVKGSKCSANFRFNEDKVMDGKTALKNILVDIIDNSPCNKVYKKTVWEGIRFPVGRRFEDVATIYKTFHNSNEIGYMKKAFYYYLKREGSAIALSFDAQRRFENFLGYKERYEFAQIHCKEAIEKCKMFAVKTALSVITAYSAGSGSIESNDKMLLMDFLKNDDNVKELSGKNKLLLWGAKNCPMINTVYGKMSMWSKKFK
ncbi:MAG: glycosyltransferase family 2 protein [Phascolarctobacterium sp.]|nr:glycosyltransferase family 2 protein [Phascolarctobacterium sp.]